MPRPHRENWPGALGHSRCSRDFIHRLHELLDSAVAPGTWAGALR